MTDNRYDTIPPLEQKHYFEYRRTSCKRPNYVAPCDRHCFHVCNQCHKKKNNCTCHTHKKEPKKAPTFRDLLLSLVNEQVEVTTPFGVITGTLIAVKNDFIVLIENTGDQVHVRINKIELVSETT